MIGAGHSAAPGGAIRFLGGVLALWVGGRCAVYWLPADSASAASYPAAPYAAFARIPLLPDDVREEAERAAAAPQGAVVARARIGAPAPALATGRVPAPPAQVARVALVLRPAGKTQTGAVADSVHPGVPLRAAAPVAVAALTPHVPAPPGPPVARKGSALHRPPPPRALRTDAWVLWRPGSAQPRASAGAAQPVLGGSQVGARVAVPLAPSGVELFARASSPLSRLPGSRGRGAEVAAGVAYRPSPRIPVSLSLERRQALDKGGRSAFAVGLAGGQQGDGLPLGLHYDLWAQAGVVGTRRRDGYAEGLLSLTRPVGLGLRVGGFIAGGVQPGVQRVELGPRVSWTPTAGSGAPPVTVSMDWRQRVAGNARPGSGVAVTVSTGF